MRIETFLDKFDLFADAPNAIEKMRELVLLLAVQGRLADPNPDDEPIDAFLDRIWKDEADPRSHLIDIKHVEHFAVPANWQWVVLGEIVDFAIGKTPPRKDSQYWHPENHYWVSIADMTHYGTIVETKEKVSTLACEKVFRDRFVEAGSVLMSFKLTIGKIARTAVRCFHNEAIISFNTPEAELREYLFRLLPEFAALQTVNNAIKGSTLNKELLTSMPVALPPLAEQKRIVAKVDELMALCDALEAQQQERQTRHAALAHASLARFADQPTPDNLNFLFHKSYDITPEELRKSILALAVRGKLIMSQPSDEPVGVLLSRNDDRRITVSKSDRRAKPAAIAMLSEDMRWDVPDTWAWRALADLVLFVDYRGKTPKKSGEGVRLITAKNVRPWTINSEPEEFISEKEYRTWMTRGLPKVGDVLFTTEAPMGNAAVVRDSERFALAQRTICFQGYGAVDSAFLVLQLLSDDFQAMLVHNGTGVTAKGIKGAKLKRLPIVVPPLAEQRRIVAKVDQLMALVDELEAQLAAERSAAAALMDALVAELTDPTESSPA